MSVAAMTMDDQRPLMNNFETMKTKYDNVTNTGGVAAATGGVAPPSGPASPTPSVSEEPHHHHHHHHTSTSSSSHHHHHHHHQQLQQQQHQLQQQTTLQQQQQAHQQLNYDAQAAAAAVVVAEQRQHLLEEEIESLKVEQTRLSQQCVDAQRREKILMRRLANKEQEFQDYVSQIAEYKAAQAPGAAALRSALLDPAVNLLFEKLKKELKATKAKLEETQNELSAWKFTPDSNTGKRLMAKCRLLYQENEELGKMTSNGRLAKLETELAMQKSFSEEVKKSQSELDDFLQELDEDVEGMQSTILFLQQELKTTRDRIQILEKENYQLKNGSGVGSNENTTDADALASHNGNNNVTNSTAAIINNIINSQQMPSVNANVNKFQTLETIDENICLRTAIPNSVNLPPTNAASTNEFYNGIQEHILVNPYVTSSIAATSAAADEGNSNSNSSNNGVVCNKLRTPASRKRNYDSDSNDNLAATPVAVAVAAPIQQQPQVVVATPRTLPPKKSKLRVTPVRRASVQSVDMNENDNAVPMVNPLPLSAGVLDAVTLTAAAAGQSPFVDNAVAGMANEEGTLLMAIDDDNTNGGGNVAQRIMTRRRSVRNQQNGDSNH